MVHRPDTVAYLQRVGLRQSRRQPGLRLDNGGRPVRVTRAQRRQRGGERTAGAVGIFGLHSRRGEPLFPFAGEEPVRAFGIVEMAALHQYRAAAQRQQRPPLLQHFPFVTRMGGIE